MPGSAAQRRRAMTVTRTKVRTKPAPLVAVVDDDESVRDAIQNMLRSAGLRAETYASAEDFLDTGHPEDSDCVVLDIRMPGMSGLQLQRRLADDGHAIPTIFVTAYADESARHQAIEAGASAFLRKPFDPDSLLQSVQSVLAQTKQRR
jgi:FixJ family two-component response regulator